VSTFGPHLGIDEIGRTAHRLAVDLEDLVRRGAELARRDHVDGGPAEVDLATAPRLDEALRDRDGELTLDCLGLAFIDSTGLNVLLRASDRLRRAGGALSIVGLSDSCRRTIECAGVGGLLGVRNGQTGEKAAS